MKEKTFFPSVLKSFAVIGYELFRGVKACGWNKPQHRC
ncbi:MAG: hypothetical protein BWY31_01172 [Lentisphaerae bacterium ADurb.Bin242]|nr:MAG: hypothetical protein BWY31_01172 [Lentisphaerae bacterium ADurb.Bin242]